eukprot:CAMPEP_0194519146 /NCGR_PEP_ID=MMETSP0253-20130528/52738_1 /TAXON_ID=2966 /ORGANISM="Noctiluca scintillans" /LENGTH=150 /DNA_ID=CAMNT_0039363247 /DNA_START=240 /DNA_END=692 /DNA_ORIENTATION=+
MKVLLAINGHQHILDGYSCLPRQAKATDSRNHNPAMRTIPKADVALRRHTIVVHHNASRSAILQPTLLPPTLFLGTLLSELLRTPTVATGKKRVFRGASWQTPRHAHRRNLLQTPMLPPSFGTRSSFGPVGSIDDDQAPIVFIEEIIKST